MATLGDNVYLTADRRKSLSLLRAPPNRDIRSNQTYAVLEPTLRPGRYALRFLEVADGPLDRSRPGSPP